MAELKPVQPTEGISLSRWSRLKRAAADEQTARAEPVEVLIVADKGNDSISTNAKIGVPANAEYAELPPMSAISLAEDFTPFMQAKVPQALKQQALKALFKEPHFNVMDGLDIYIDDYTVFEPISPEVMATLSSWKTIMNPPQQVVTNGGYAVDVESEEGKAVLAARAELASLDQVALSSDDTPHPSPLPRGERGYEAAHASDVAGEQISSASPLAGDATRLSPTGSRAEGAGTEANQTLVPLNNKIPVQHARHNKRVGDFTYVDTPEIPPLGAEKAE